MKKHRLTPRQKLFVEYCRLVHTYPTQTDAYIAVYKPKGSRRTATASASRIANKPSVRAYSDQLWAIDEQRRIEREDAEHRRFRESLGIELD